LAGERTNDEEAGSNKAHLLGLHRPLASFVNVFLLARFLCPLRSLRHSTRFFV